MTPWSWWTVFAYPVFAAAAYYLGAQAKITEFLWSRYPRGSTLEYWALCAACSPFGYGVALAAGFGRSVGWSFLPGVDGAHPASWVFAGLWCLYWCPHLALLHLRSLGAVLGPWESIPRPDARRRALRAYADKAASFLEEHRVGTQPLAPSEDSNA